MKFLLLSILCGYVAADDLTCLPGKILNPCGDLCQVTCRDITTNNFPKGCPRICKPPACVCPGGQASIRGRCVDYLHCWRLPAEDEDFVIKYNCDYGGFDISSLQDISSVDECAAECYKTPSCTHLTYNGNNKICFLKHAESKQKILDQRHESHNAYCAYYNGEDRFGAAAAVSKNFIINENCDYRGSDISSIQNMSSVGECAAQCYKLFSCTHVTYNGNNKFCFLKHADTKQQILDKRYDSYNAWCVYYNGEDRFGAAAAILKSKMKLLALRQIEVVLEADSYFIRGPASGKLFLASSIQCLASGNLASSIQIRMGMRSGKLLDRMAIHTSSDAGKAG